MRLRRPAILSAYGLLFVASGGSLLGQAWLPPKGQGSISLNAQSTDSDIHYVSTRDNPVSPGTRHLDFDDDTDARGVSIGFDYGLTEHLALSGQAAYVGGRYIGTDPEGSTDDGEFHSGLQDASLRLRYQFQKNHWVFTPSVTLGTPMSSYETLSHSAIGQGLDELGIGVHVGRSLRQLFSRPAYIETSYSYSFFEEVDDLSLNRSSASFEVGVLVTPRTAVRLFSGAQITHGGIDWITDFQTEEDFVLNFAAHESFAASNFVNVGLGVGFELTPQLNVNASYFSTVWGENYQDVRGLIVGFQTSFGGVKIGGKPDRHSGSN